MNADRLLGVLRQQIEIQNRPSTSGELASAWDLTHGALWHYLRPLVDAGQVVRVENVCGHLPGYTLPEAIPLPSPRQRFLALGELARVDAVLGAVANYRAEHGRDPTPGCVAAIFEVSEQLIRVVLRVAIAAGRLVRKVGTWALSVIGRVTDYRAKLAAFAEQIASDIPAPAPLPPLIPWKQPESDAPPRPVDVEDGGPPRRPRPKRPDYSFPAAFA